METDASKVQQIVLVGAMTGNAILLAGAAVWFCLRTWGGQRRLERESFYRSELYKQMLERGELTLDKLQDIRRHDEEAALVRARRALRLAGILFLALATGLFIGFWTHEDATPRRIAAVPLSVGIALVVYAAAGMGSGARRAP